MGHECDVLLYSTLHQAWGVAVPVSVPLTNWNPGSMPGQGLAGPNRRRSVSSHEEPLLLNLNGCLPGLFRWVLLIANSLPAARLDVGGSTTSYDPSAIAKADSQIIRSSDSRIRSQVLAPLSVEFISSLSKQNWKGKRKLRLSSFGSVAALITCRRGEQCLLCCCLVN